MIFRRSHFMPALLLLCGLASCARAPRVDVASAAASLPLPAGVTWAPNPFLAQGAQWAVVSGTPQAGGAYAMRIRFPANFRVMPHTHPDDRIYTVLAGRFEIGIGASYDSTKFSVSGAGDVVRVPALTPHFHRSQQGVTEFQVNGTGPTGITYLDPAHDPRRKSSP